MKQTIAAFGLVAITLAGCGAQELPDNDPSRVERVVESDGCTLYRYRRAGEYPVYWTKCEGSAPSVTSTTQRSGKTSRPTRVQTN